MSNGVRVHRLVGSLIEAHTDVCSLVVDAETGETVTTNVPVGSVAWRVLARAARNYIDKPRTKPCPRR